MLRAAPFGTCPVDVYGVRTTPIGSIAIMNQ
jgi:hypothetical protein